MYSKYTICLLLTCCSFKGWGQTGYISTIAGNGTLGSGGDGGAAISCELAHPHNVICAANGDLYVSENSGQRLRKIEVGTGNISLFASGNFLKTPSGMAFDAAGNVLVADTYRYRIVKVTPGGTISSLTNGGEGTSPDGTTAYMTRWQMPADVATDLAGNIYVVDEMDNKVKKIEAVSGTLVTVAGTGTEGLYGDGGPATNAQLRFPSGIAVDAAGNIYIADNGNHRIRRVSPDGNINTIAGTTAGFAGDWGPAANAKLFNPNDVMVSGDKLFIADMNNNRIRMIDGTGIITTVAGNGSPGYGGDGGNALSAQLHYPTSVNRDNTGNLLISDMVNNRIRKVMGVVGVKEVREDGVAISIFPNPATDVVQVQLPEGVYQWVSLVNSVGQLVMRREINGTKTELSIANQPAGNYYIILKAETGLTMRKITKL